jgi:hypothetical protein
MNQFLLALFLSFFLILTNSFSCESLAAVAANRFKYFTEQLFPSLVEEMERGVLVYIPSYFDFVRIRNFLRQKKKAGVLSFAQCCEYVITGYDVFVLFVCLFVCLSTTQA